MRLRQFCLRGSRPDFGAGGWSWRALGEGCWFSPGPTALLHFRPSTGGFRCALPGGLDAGWDSLEPDYLRLNPLGNRLRVDLRPVPPGGVSFLCAADVMRASAGMLGAF